MRVHLLLILFFASTILARSTRNRRDTNVITLEPSAISTTVASNGNTTTDVTGDKSDGIIHCRNNIQPLKVMSKLVKSAVLNINNTLSTLLKTLNSTGDVMLHLMMQPIAGILKIMIRIMSWMLQYL